MSKKQIFQLDRQIDRLVFSLNNPPEPWMDVQAILDAAHSFDELPPPHLTWALIGLLKYYDRKRWAWDTLVTNIVKDVRQRLGQEMEDCPDESRGYVRGYPEWEYELFGNTSHVHNRVTGERIHFDTLNGPQPIYDHLFAEYALRKVDDDDIWSRLRELHPTAESLEVSTRMLRESRVLHVTDEIEFDLCPGFVKRADSFRSFAQRWSNNEDRLELAIGVGDWMAAEKYGRTVVETKIFHELSSKANECVTRRMKVLHRQEEFEQITDPEVLRLLAGVTDVDDLPAAIRRTMEDSFQWASIAEVFEDSKICERYLERREDEACDLISAMEEANCCDIALRLALKFSRRHILQLVRKSLRSESEQARHVAVAVMVLFATDWSIAELDGVLNEQDDWHRSQVFRAGLMMIERPSAEAATKAWIKENMRGVLRFIRVRRACAAKVINEMDDLRETLAELRGWSPFDETE